MLEISRLTKAYPGGVCALREVDLSIGRGLFGLLGPNGAGKSTLMRILATLQEPDAGTVVFDGRDVLAAPGWLRDRLGYLPQEFGVYPGVPAARLLDHVAVLKGILDPSERSRQVDALLGATRLSPVRHRPVSTFSGGMKQRFGIALALLGDPRLLIVDEPTAGLDPEERQRFHNLLAELGERMVVLVSTHIVADIASLCSRMAILDSGRVAATGRPAELVGSLAGRVWTRTVKRSAVPGYRRRYRLLSTHLVAGATRIRLLAPERPGPGFEPVEPDLEDLYFAVRTAPGKSGEAGPC